MKIDFISLQSGSNGNCYYLGTEEYGVLIDAGIPLKQIKQSLKNVGLSFDKVVAVFVTHDHADHIKSLSAIGEKCHIPIYATELTHQGINRNYCMSEKLVQSVRFVEKDTPLLFRDMVITPFEVPHDGTDNVGYHISIAGTVFCFVTDLGYIPDTITKYIRTAHYLIIESNYDEEMLHSGHYPRFLKERISGKAGHLSNSATAAFLAKEIEEHLQHIWLCHLSGENNHPELALKTVEYALRGVGVIAGVDVQLTVLKRSTPSELYTFHTK